jgi:hypothetical protein
MGATLDEPASFSGRSHVSRKGIGHAALPPEEARVRAIAETVNHLIQAVKQGQDVDLNQLKTEVQPPALPLKHCALGGTSTAVCVLCQSLSSRLAAANLVIR